jgi:hypothetical protein
MFVFSQTCNMLCGFPCNNFMSVRADNYSDANAGTWTSILLSFSSKALIFSQATYGHANSENILCWSHITDANWSDPNSYKLIAQPTLTTTTAKKYQCLLTHCYKGVPWQTTNSLTISSCKYRFTASLDRCALIMMIRWLMSKLNA